MYALSIHEPAIGGKPLSLSFRKTNVRSLALGEETTFARGVLTLDAASLAAELKARDERLEAIRGHVPSPLQLPPGCGFASRCPLALERCAADLPLLKAMDADGHRAACWLLEEER